MTSLLKVIFSCLDGSSCQGMVFFTTSWFQVPGRGSRLGRVLGQSREAGRQDQEGPLYLDHARHRGTQSHLEGQVLWLGGGHCLLSAYF
jgi:hypothetical protein